MTLARDLAIAVIVGTVAYIILRSIRGCDTPPDDRDALSVLEEMDS